MTFDPGPVSASRVWIWRPDTSCWLTAFTHHNTQCHENSKWRKQRTRENIHKSFYHSNNTTRQQLHQGVGWGYQWWILFKIQLLNFLPPFYLHVFIFINIFVGTLINILNNVFVCVFVNVSIKVFVDVFVKVFVNLFVKVFVDVFINIFIDIFINILIGIFIITFIAIFGFLPILVTILFPPSFSTQRNSSHFQ